MLYGSSKIELRDLSVREENRLRQLSVLCRDLYNLSTQLICSHYEQTGAIPDFQDIKRQLCSTDTYQALGGCYYQVILTSIADFKKYISTDMYALRLSDKSLQVKNLDKFYPPKPKTGFRNIELKHPPICTGGVIVLPGTRERGAVRLRLPEVYWDKDIASVTVRPMHHLSHWELIINYTVPQVTHSCLDPHCALGIDLGVSNYMTCVDSLTGESFIIDGRRLKSILQGYCKYRAKLQRRGSGSTDNRRMSSLLRKTDHKVNDYVCKSVSKVIAYCIEHGIGRIVLGWGIHFQGANLGKNSQLYALMPFARLKAALTWQCRKHGIFIDFVDECYTSQASCIDLDEMPEHITAKPQQFSGKRIHRGLYMSADGILLNADVNGAVNILRKSRSVNPVFLSNWRDGRGITSPQRIDPLK